MPAAGTPSAYVQGYAAANDGLPNDANPYGATLPDEWNQWNEGWHDAMYERAQLECGPSLSDPEAELLRERCTKDDGY